MSYMGLPVGAPFPFDRQECWREYAEHCAEHDGYISDPQTHQLIERWHDTRAASSAGLERLLDTQEARGSNPLPPTCGRVRDSVAVAALG